MLLGYCPHPIAVSNLGCIRRYIYIYIHINSMLISVYAYYPTVTQWGGRTRDKTFTQDRSRVNGRSCGHSLGFRMQGFGYRV